MRRQKYVHRTVGPYTYTYPVESRRRYGCFNFLLDLFMIGITSGLWIIWIVIRESRYNY